MAKKQILLFLTIVLFGFFGWVYFAQAGFGVSPPMVINDRLIRGSHIEETIWLVRGDPYEDMMAEIIIDDSEIKDWIKIDKGLSFLLPKGEVKVPMNIIIDVPKDAKFKNYQGYMQVKAIPNSGQEGQVATVLGVRVDINLTVSEKGFFDFEVRGASVPDFEKGSPMVVLMSIRNTGNQEAQPSKVHVDVYDINHLKILKSIDIFETGKVKPFETSQIQGSSPMDLELGEYWADVRVFKEESPLGVFTVHFAVVPEGTLKKVVEKKEGLSSTDYKLGAITIIMVLIIFAWINKDKIKLVLKKKKIK